MKGSSLDWYYCEACHYRIGDEDEECDDKIHQGKFGCKNLSVSHLFDQKELKKGSLYWVLGILEQLDESRSADFQDYVDVGRRGAIAGAGSTVLMDDDED